ncbi:MAG: hypothetical protein WCS37_01845, partial [Chloroflexota bacterium]
GVEEYGSNLGYWLAAPKADNHNQLPLGYVGTYSCGPYWWAIKLTDSSPSLYLICVTSVYNACISFVRTIT